MYGRAVKAQFICNSTDQVLFQEAQPLFEKNGSILQKIREHS